jgi:hypothetical protein
MGLKMELTRQERRWTAKVALVGTILAALIIWGGILCPLIKN